MIGEPSGAVLMQKVEYLNQPGWDQDQRDGKTCSDGPATFPQKTGSKSLKID